MFLGPGFIPLTPSSLANSSSLDSFLHALPAHCMHICSNYSTLHAYMIIISSYFQSLSPIGIRNIEEHAVQLRYIDKTKPFKFKVEIMVHRHFASYV